MQVPRLRSIAAAAAVIVAAWPDVAAAGEVPSRSDIARGDFGAASLLLALAGWIVFLGLRERWGRTPEGEAIVDDDGSADSILVLPDDPPPVAATLHAGGLVPSEVHGAIVLDLARRGYLGIEEIPSRAPGEPSDWQFHRLDTPRGDLRQYENAVFSRLFAVGNEIRQSELATWARGNRPRAEVFVERIRRYIGAELEGQGYVEDVGRLPVTLNLGTAGAVALLGIMALVQGAWVGLLAVASAGGQAALTRTLRRRTIAGSRRALEWSALVESLTSVGDSERTPEGDIDGWERCLVYAAVLGVADPFLDGLRRREASLLAGDDFARWFHGRDPRGRLASIGAFTASFGRALEAAAEPPRGSTSRLPAVRRS